MVRWPALALLAAVAHAGPARACTPDPCAATIAFVGLEPASDSEVPTDGVLVMRANWFGTFESDALLAGLELTVQLADELVPGALEATDITGVLVWRPAQPLAPGATYQVHAAFTNPADVPPVCAAQLVVVDFEFLTASGPAVPLAVPRITGSQKLIETPLVDLASIVCCDGAYPREQEFCGISHGLAWSQGQCTSVLTSTVVRLDMYARPEVDDATASQLVFTLYTDDEPGQAGLGARFGRAIDKPTCFRVTQRSLATGESTVSDETCFANAYADQVGDKPTDPALDGCQDPPYTCELAADDAGWDPDACTPFTADTLTDAAVPNCGCTTTDPAALLACPLLLLLRRRRV